VRDNDAVSPDTVTEPPANRVLTGADGDGRHPVLSLLAGLLGWVLWAALVVWLASEASADALEAATFLVTVIVTVALLLVLTGAGLLRPSLMRQRARTPRPAERALERAMPVTDHPDELTGEIGLETQDGRRRYVPLTRASP
jgi:hypothetical protein